MSLGAGDGVTIATCAWGSQAEPCASRPGTTCIDGYCLAPTAKTCHLADDGRDGCEAGAICRDDGTGARCFRAPPCPSNGICPDPGSDVAGATCRDGLCVPGRCLTDVDCNQRGSCVRQKPGDVVGHCVDLGNDTLETDDQGAGWESENGCAIAPSILVGKAAAGAKCAQPTQCAPTCCACGGGAVRLAAKCALSGGANGAGGDGKCASPSEACAAVFVGGESTCTVPAGTK